MAEELEQLGFDETYALLGGWEAWRDAGLPVAPKTDADEHAPV